MKALLYKRYVVLLCLFVGGVAGAYAQEGVKEKKITKTFSVGENDRLSVENSYGKVHINTWDKKEISVEVKILALHKNDSKAQELLDRIKISDIRTSGRISYKTIISTGNLVMNGKQSMSIDYTIYIPVGNPLSVVNKFGDVYLDDFSGELDLHVAYGALKAGKLSGVDKAIKVQFGSAVITSIESGRLDIQYSKLNIEKAQKIDVINMFGSTNITSVQNLKIDQRYGSMNVGTVAQMSGKIEFADFDVTKLLKSIDLTMKYCSRADFGLIGSGVELIRVNANFSSLYFKFDDSSNMNFNINTRFGEFKPYNSSRFTNYRKDKEGSTNGGAYSGSFGRGNEGAMVITLSYGNIYF
jgi:hypothetical protein